MDITEQMIHTNKMIRPTQKEQTLAIAVLRSRIIRRDIPEVERLKLYSDICQLNALVAKTERTRCRNNHPQPPGSSGSVA
jgi:hypothetical protein